MANKMFNTSPLASEEIAEIFDSADKHPRDFIRIVFRNGTMLYSNKKGFEFRISKAIIAIWDKDGMHPLLFWKNINKDVTFQCAIYPNQFMILTLEKDSFYTEKRYFFQNADRCIVIMKTYNSTIFISYAGDHSEFIGHDYVMEKAGYASVTDLLASALFDSPKPKEASESSTGGNYDEGIS